MGIYLNKQRVLKDENIARPDVGYTVRQLMRLQQSAVIPDGSMISMESYTPSELGEFGVSPLNKIGLELDDIQSIREFGESVSGNTALASSAPVATATESVDSAQTASTATPTTEGEV